ncbi:MAG TPA: hypothetical protein VIX11_15105 [Candidatus Acidoferrum sp.]
MPFNLHHHTVGCVPDGLDADLSSSKPATEKTYVPRTETGFAALFHNDHAISGRIAISQAKGIGEGIGVAAEEGRVIRRWLVVAGLKSGSETLNAVLL